MTPHINAKKGEIAKTVLMPGDPLRAKFIAKTFLDPGFKQVNTVRNMNMYTGTYHGKPITIAASGMGCPSMGIYSFELFKFYDVDRIIRIGTAGAYKKDLNLYDTVLAKDAYADSGSYRKLVLGEEFESNIATPSEELNNEILNIAKKIHIPITMVRAHSSDVFYSSVPLNKRIENSQADCVEMEAFALFTNAQKLGKKAACLLTISDNLITQEETNSEERQKAFTNMMRVALNLAK